MANDTSSRIKGKTVEARYQFGTPEEIGGRVGSYFKTDPESAPSNFKQLGPDGGGSNPIERSPRAVSGNQKFGNPRRYA